MYIYSFEFAQSYFHPKKIRDWFAQSWFVLYPIMLHINPLYISNIYIPPRNKWWKRQKQKNLQKQYGRIAMQISN